VRKLSIPQFRSAPGRAGLVVGGIATGVALIVAIDIVNTSVLANFRRSVEAMAGPASLEVTLSAGEVGFPEGVIDRVREDPGVEAAVPIVQGTVTLETAHGEVLRLFGVDLMSERDLGRYPIEAEVMANVGHWIHDPASILLPVALARDHALSVGSRVTLGTPQGLGEFTVRGLLRTRGAASALGGRLAVMDLPAAQLTMAKEARLDRIDVIVREGTEVEVVRRRLEAALPEPLAVSRPQQRGQHVERFVGSFQAMMTGLSLLCLVAGIYIVYSTTSTGAIQRALGMASLRLMGAEGADLFKLLLVEAVLLGGVGAVIGVPGGVGLAWLLTDLVSESMGTVYQLRFPAEGIAINWPTLAWAGCLGTAASLVASFFAARRAVDLEPLEIIRADFRTVGGRTRNGGLVLCWMGMVCLSAVALVLEVRLRSIWWGNLGSTLWFASSVVIAIPLVTLSARGLARVLTGLWQVPGRLAAESLFHAPSRTGVTVAAVALVLTIAVTFASLVESIRRSTARYYEAGGFLSGDLVVSAVTTEGGWLETPLSQDVLEEIEGLPGVASVAAARLLPGHVYRDERVAILAVSAVLLESSRLGPEWYRAGDVARASAALRAGEGMNVSVGFAERFGVAVGDRIALDAPAGPLELPVVGIVDDVISNSGTVILDRRLLVERWGETTVQRMSVFLEPGATTEAVRAAIEASVGRRHRLKVLLPGEMIDYHREMNDRAFALLDAIHLLVVVVTIVGILDLLVAAVWERRRELAVWRMIGASDRTITRSIVLESATIGALGAILGTAVGLVTASIWIRVNFRYILGYYPDHHLALGANLRYAALVVLTTMVAGYIASRLAREQSILAGLQGHGH
jgi:putative ABC transport system permease protein